ncbi:MAG: hypothetical protein HY893_07590 [Deltaproteobacteria bacterium]|nr:hypothetical protein [Deltaproteobacteria bacterium]
MRVISSDKGRAGLAAIFIFAALSASFYFIYPKFISTPAPAPAKKINADLPAPELVAEAPALSQAEESGTPLLKEASLALSKGDYARAIDFLREALKASPDSIELKEALAKALNRDAVNEYKAGNLSRAKTLIEEAVTLSGDKTFYANLASIKIRTGDLEGAKEALESMDRRDRAQDMALKSVYTRLGNKELDGNDFAPAMEYFEKALALDPGDGALRAELESLKGQAASEGKMGRAEGGHFLVKFEGGENAVTGHLIGLLLEEAYMKVGSDLGYYPADKIEALLYTNESFRDVTGSPSWAGAIFDGRIKVPAGGITGKTDELERVIFHEYTHAVVRRISNEKAPVWLNEGLAQYEEGKRSAPYAEGLKKAALSGKLSLRALEGSFMNLDADGARTAYLLSLSATEYIIGEFGIFSAKKVIEARADGMALDKAIQSALYLSYEELEKSWVSSLASP